MKNNHTGYHCGALEHVRILRACTYISAPPTMCTTSKLYLMLGTRPIECPNLPRDVDALCEDQEEESVMSWSRNSVSSGVEMLNYTRSRFPKLSSVISAPRFPSLPLKSPWWHSQVDQSQPGLQCLGYNQSLLPGGKWMTVISHRLFSLEGRMVDPDHNFDLIWNQLYNRISWQL